MANPLYRLIYSDKRSKVRDLTDVRIRTSKRLSENRKAQREAILNVHRHLDILPEVKERKTEQQERLMRLKAFQEQKLKKRIEERKKCLKPPFYSSVRVRHTGGTPFRSNGANPAIAFGPATRARTAGKKDFKFTMKGPFVKDDPVVVNHKPMIIPVMSKSSRRKEIVTASTSRSTRQLEIPVTSTSRSTKEKEIPIASTIRSTRQQGILVASTSRSTKRKEIPIVTTSRFTGQRQIVTNKNNVATSAVVHSQINNLLKPDCNASHSKIPNKSTNIRKGNVLNTKHISNSTEELSSAGLSGSKKVVNVKKSKKKISNSTEELSSAGLSGSKKVVNGKKSKKKISRSTDQLSSAGLSGSKKMVNLQKGENKVVEFKEVTNLLASKVGERVFIMSPVVTSNVVTRSTRRRPRPSIGNDQTFEIKLANEEAENESQSETVGEECTIGPAEALRNKLEEETIRLNRIADMWSKRHIEDSIPEHVKDEILAIVGQTRLLLSDKFKQFRSLIINSQSKNEGSGAVIKADDLLGFWEMMYLEVEQLNRKYENLTNLGDNGWHSAEKLRAVCKLKKKVVTKKPTKIASSKFKEFLSKKKQKEANNDDLNNITFQVTPVKRTPSLMRTFDSEIRTRRRSSAITLQKSFLAKAVFSPSVKS